MDETIRLFQEEKSTKAKLNIIFSKLNMPVRTHAREKNARTHAYRHIL